jgi:predicted RNA-binding protein
MRATSFGGSEYYILSMNQEVRMCLSTVYIDSDTGKEEFMRDVAEMEAEGDGFFLVSLFGERRFIKGSIKRVDFVDEHTVEMERDVRL